MAKLFIMCGIPGSGKTTEANRLGNVSGRPFAVLSADDVRADLYGDSSVQGDGNLVFTILDQRVHEALCDGKDVYYDCTSVRAKGRRSVVRRFHEAESVSVVWLDTPLDVCIARNAARSRHVPNEVILGMAKKFQKPSVDEGFAEIIRVTAFKNGRD